MAASPTARTYSFRLPFPPSANTHWRRAGTMIYLSPQGRAYRRAVLEEVFAYNNVAIRGRVAVSIELVMRDRRKTDIDNRIKPLLDSLVHAGIIVDDEQVDELYVKRLHVEPPGCADVTITELEP